MSEAPKAAEAGAQDHFCVPAQCPCPRGVEHREKVAARVLECTAEIDAALKKHNCALVGVPQYAQINQSNAWATVIRVELVPKG